MKKISIVCAFLMVVFLLCVTLAEPFPVPDTGQTGDYTATFGEDSDYDINTQSYTQLDASGNDMPFSADYSTTPWAMVRDNVTGLIWEVKTNNDPPDIHDKGATYDWQDAQDVFITALNTAEFGGYDDWRMPTPKELSFIVHSDTAVPSFDQNYFPNTEVSNYWSSTTNAKNTENAWIVNFNYGYVSHYFKSGNYYVRAVRGEQFSNDFIDNGDTLTDTATGLMWQQATAPGTYTWEQALTYCEGLSLAEYDDWRLPNRNELQSIVDYSQFTPTIDQTYFPDTEASYYWPSTTNALYTGGVAWGVSFNYGSVIGNSYSYHYYVRAVRGGQCGSFGDSDIDGICDDGNVSGVVGDNPCTGGETVFCDDNCPDDYNPDQEDSDGDGIGDACECEVSLSIGETNAAPGDASVQVPVSMSNPDHEVVAVETLLMDEPNNLTCTGCTPDPVRASEFMCFAYEQGEGGCKVVMVDPTDPTGVIEQGDGPIFTVDYMASGGAPSNECISVTSTDSIIADDLEDSLIVCEGSGEICFITCGDVWPGETCGDGAVNIFDILEVIDIVLGIGEHSDCQLTQADVPNGIPPNCREPNGEINIFDILVIIDVVLQRDPNCCNYTTVDNIPPAAPTGLRIVNGDSSSRFLAYGVTLPLRLAWDRNTESDLAFYTVYYGTSSRNYNHFIDVDKQYPYWLI